MTIGVRDVVSNTAAAVVGAVLGILVLQLVYTTLPMSTGAGAGRLFWVPPVVLAGGASVVVLRRSHGLVRSGAIGGVVGQVLLLSLVLVLFRSW